MEYYCEGCDSTYTIPQGDILIEKNKDCECGRKSKYFKLTTTLIFKSRDMEKTLRGYSFEMI
jgi:hypothetical protein